VVPRRIVAVSSSGERQVAFTDARVEACTYEALAQSEPPIALWVAYIDRDRAGAQIAALSGAPIVAVVEPAA